MAKRSPKTLINRFRLLPYDQASYRQPRACIRALKRAGFDIDRQKGSHITLIRDAPFARVTVPDHTKDLKQGTLRQIIRDAGLTVEEFVELLR